MIQVLFMVISNLNLFVFYFQFLVLYQNMGFQFGFFFIMNYLFKLDFFEEYMVDWNKVDIFELNVYIVDGDGIQYDFFGFFVFLQVQVLVNGSI